MKRLIPLAICFLLSIGPAVPQATPPERINYQGVLRDASNNPLDGSYDMIFRFYDAENGGNLLLTDSHAVADAVTVTGGLFNVLLGDGTLAPGTHGSLAEVFANESDVYLEVQVAAETLTPRIRMASAAHALNAARLEGRPAGDFLDTSSAAQVKAGDLALNDLTVNGNDISFGGGSSILSTPGNLQFRNDGDTDDLFLLAGNSWDDGRIILFGGDRIEFRAGNGKFNFFNGSSSDPIAELFSDGSLSLGGGLSVGDVPLRGPDGPLDLYVDASGGDDSNDGLSPTAAKQTIQAAIDAIPAVLNGDVTVHVKPGTYSERVRILERGRVNDLHWIRLIADPLEDPPTVFIDGTTVPVLSDGVATAGVFVSQALVEIVGIHVRNFRDPDQDNEAGFEVSAGGLALLRNCRSTQNNLGLFLFEGQAFVWDTHFNQNDENGVFLAAHGYLEVGEGTEIADNEYGGWIENGSFLAVDEDAASPTNPCVVTNNDLAVETQSSISELDRCVITNSSCLAWGTGECSPPVP